MYKKLIYLVSFVLVLGLVPTNAAGAADPDLIGWWKLDEGSGDIAIDSSGNGFDIPLQNTTWENGKFGGALHFLNEGEGIGGFNYSDNAITVCAWVWHDAFRTGQVERYVTASPEIAVIRKETDGRLHFYINTGGSLRHLRVSNVLTEGQWHHVAGTWDGLTQRLYIDGVEIASQEPGGVLGDASGVRLSNAPEHLNGKLDDVRIYNRALTEQEINGVMLGGGAEYPLASGPNPADGALLTDTWVSLGWLAGDSAVSHDVYLGDNFEDVNNGTSETFRGNQPLTSTILIVGFAGFPFPDGLVPGTTYYWRIDEVNDADPNSPWKGPVWSFWIPPYTAYNPNPADGVKFVPQDVELNWMPGFRAKLHYVYFGDNFDDVNNAVMGIPQPTTTYTPGTLEIEKTYYWRVDEFDGVTTIKGDVWSFSTIPDIAITDPSLIGWWKLDEGYGTTAVDWSGHGNHGTFVGDPQWVAGYDGDALEFDGDGDFLDCGANPSLEISGAVSITAWIKVGEQGLDHKVGGNQDGSNGGYKMSVQSDKIEFEIRTSDNTAILNRNIAGGTVLQTDVWYHVAGIYSQADSYIRTYVNGVLDRELVTTEELGASPGTLYIGCEPYNTSAGNFNGVIDNVRLYNKALTPEDIQLAMRGDPLAAWGPNPTNGSTPYIKEATPLSWSPGDNASQHDVYFGTDKDAVDNADASDTTGIYRGRQGVTIYTTPEVEWGGGPYYWRIDEYNTDATISKGNVWSFTVTDFIGIDDIEDYNDYPPDEIFSTWIDGWEVPTNGSMAGHADPPFAETSIVHGGGQSMPLYYENNFKYSEATMTLVWPRDWTEEGVGVLSLWFYGDAANAAERMYVNLNGIATVYHSDPSAAQIDTWTEWRIDLQKFAAQGVNLSNVNTISIGFGDKNNLRAGGSGMVLFDDIRLYRPAPE
jgi:hypothetical protein